jgi:hypothetical protein
MKLPSTYDALVKEASNLDLYEKLIIQLNKDFLLSNIDEELPKNSKPTLLKLRLQEIVYNLIQEKFAEYLNFLYIVDVPENKIRQLDGSDILKLSEQVAFLILLREWQKVWYRNNY